MYSKQDLDLIADVLVPAYAGMLFTADQVAVSEALAAVAKRTATDAVVKALVTLAKAHKVAPEIVANVEGYVALAWRTARH